MLQRIQFTVQSYKDLQGLVVTTLGTTLLLYVIWHAWLLWVFFPQGLPDELDWLAEMIACAGFITLCISFARAYYRRAFGRVNPPDESRSPRINTIEWFIICISLITIGIGADISLHLHISIICLACAAALVLRWYHLRKTLHYYLVLAALMIGLSFLPFLPAVHQIFLHPKSDQFNNTLLGWLACLLIVVGICDHVALVLNMRKVRSLMLLHSKLEQGE